MKVVFLDIDGVIIHEGYHNRETENLDSDKIEILKKLIDDTDAKIVLISNWRVFNNDDDKDIYGLLENEFLKKGLSIYEDTPIFKPEILTYEKDTNGIYKNIKYNPFTTRGGEIKSYLNNHADIESFVIIDDQNIDYDYFGFSDKFVQIDRSVGLTLEDINKAEMVLNKNKKIR